MSSALDLLVDGAAAGFGCGGCRGPVSGQESCPLLSRGQCAGSELGNRAVTPILSGRSRDSVPGNGDAFAAVAAGGTLGGWILRRTAEHPGPQEEPGPCASGVLCTSFFKNQQNVHFRVEIIFQLDKPIFQKTRKCTSILMGILGQIAGQVMKNFWSLTNQVSLTPFEVCRELPA